MKNPFIKLDKSIVGSSWYQDSNTLRLWLHFLIKANPKDNKFKNLLVKRGQLATTVKSLSNELKLTAKQIRTALKKLKTANEISIKTTNEFTIINIENYWTNKEDIIFGFIKVDKKIIDWGWYQDASTIRLWLHLLIKANWKDNKFQNLLVKRGQLVTSVKSLSNELKLTTQQIRTALKKLKETKEISQKVTNKFTLINIENYCLYQGNKTQEGQTDNKQITNKQQTNNKQITTIEDIKDIKDIKERKNINPLTPLEDSEQNSNSEISGVEKQVSWEVNDIINALDDKSLQLAKINAPGWDVYHLAGIYVDGINNDIIIDGVNKGKRSKPKCIKAAFPKWCKRYTKGLRP